MFLTLLFFHLVAVALLFSGMGIEIAAVLALHRASSVEQIRAAMLNGPLVGPLMGLGALLLITMGVAMVYSGSFGWQPWDTVTLILTLALVINGPITNGRRGEAIAKMAASAQNGSIPPELHARRSDRFWNYSIFTTAFELIAALYLMSNKPGLTACIVAVALAGVAGLVPMLILTSNKTAPAKAPA